MSVDPHPPDGDAPESVEGTAIFQTQVLILAAVMFGAVVWALLELAYPEPRTPPFAFIALCGAVVVIGLFSAFPEALIGRTWSGMTGKGQYRPGRGMSWWLDRRPKAQPGIVYVLSAGLLLAFVALVWATGFGIESPYVPLVAAPAVFGPFVARRGRAVVGLVLVVGAMLILLTWQAPPSPCPERCPPEEVEVYKPRPVVYAGVAITLIVLAGIISGRTGARPCGGE
jgi:hypothetical protein